MQRYRIIIDGQQVGEVLAESEAEAAAEVTHERVFEAGTFTVDLDPAQPEAV